MKTKKLNQLKKIDFPGLFDVRVGFKSHFILVEKINELIDQIEELKKEVSKTKKYE